MRSLVFTGLTLPLLAASALAQTTPLVPAPPLTPLPTAPTAKPTEAPPTPGTTTTGTNEPPVDYPAAIWTPAAPGNYDYEDRPTEEPIDMVIVHDIEGPAQAGINIFQTKGASVSSHYIVGGDGKVYQLVREKNVAWHAGNRNINHRSVGIETHGYAYRPGWYNATIYEAEAKLIRDITTRYNIPRDRKHIIGHFEVPDPSDPTKFGGRSGHTDPGPYWDWDSFMTMIRNDSKLVSVSVPPVIRPGEILPVTVTMQNTGDDPWYANTAKSIYAVESKGPVVYLSTQEMKASPLFNNKGWVSPIAAAGTTTADVTPGTTSTYSFTIAGPTLLGAYSESLRLSLLPKMAQGGRPVAFGDSVTLATKVVPYDITVTTADALTPVTTPTPTTPVGTPSTPVSPVATWSPKLPASGVYAVYIAAPKPKKARKKEPFVYEMNATGGTSSAVIEAKQGGKGYKFVGYYNFAAANAGPLVKLTKAPAGITSADAGSLRMVGPFPVAPATPAPDANALVASTGATSP